MPLARSENFQGDAMKPLKKNATYDDLREVPDYFVAEMFSGDLYAFPRPRDTTRSRRKRSPRHFRLVAQS